MWNISECCDQADNHEQKRTTMWPPLLFSASRNQPTAWMIHFIFDVP